MEGSGRGFYMTDLENRVGDGQDEGYDGFAGSDERVLNRTGFGCRVGVVLVVGMRESKTPSCSTVTGKMFQ